MAATVPVPDTLEQVLSPAWLSAALAPRFPGIEISAVEPGPVETRLSTNARFRIECAGGLPPGLASHLCVKGYFGEAGRALRHVGEPEACFYRDLAAATGVRTLHSVYADVDPVTRHGVVITEDVLVQGATFLDGRSPYTADQAAASLEQLAKLHSATWCDPALANAPWLESRLGMLIQIGAAVVRNSHEGPMGAGIPESARDPQRLFETYRILGVEMAHVRPWSVIHGDAHVGNIFLDGDGRSALLDWQLVQRGPWYLDVGYHVASALSVDDRRRHEVELVRHYLERLAAGGVDAPTWDDAWRGIRRGILHGFYLWSITQKVDPRVTTVLLERLGTAAADHDAFGAVA